MAHCGVDRVLAAIRRNGLAVTSWVAGVVRAMLGLAEESIILVGSGIYRANVSPKSDYVTHIPP